MTWRIVPVALAAALASWVAGNGATPNSTPAANAAPAGASGYAALASFPSGSLNSALLGSPASGGSPSHAALDQLFADLVNDLNGLTHAGL